MNTVQTCRIKFESLSKCQYKLSNIWIHRKVIYRLTKFYQRESNFSYNANSILKGLLKICSHEKDIIDKGRGRRGAAKQHTDEFQGHRDALERIQGHQDQSSSDQCAFRIYGRLPMSIHRSTDVRAGVNRERHRDCVQIHHGSKRLHLKMCEIDNGNFID